EFRIRLVNRTADRTLYCGLLNLTEAFAINAGLHEASCVRLGPGEEAWCLQGRFIAARLPDQLWQQGVVEFKDILKLIVATQEFDVRLLTQGPLDVAARSVLPGPPPRGGLNRLMSRVQARDLKPVAEGEAPDDWWATQVTFTTVRP